MKKIRHDFLKTLLRSWQAIPEDEWQETRLWLEPILQWDKDFLKRPQSLATAKHRKPWRSSAAQKISTTYDQLLRRYPQQLSRACAWESPENQEAILEDIIDVGNLEGASILDLGCGPASLLSFLKRKRIKPGKYLGVDVSLAMIRKAKKLFPKKSFVVGDVFDSRAIWQADLPNRSFDYVLLSGIFAFRPKGWSEAAFNQVILQTLRHYLPMARKGLAFNIIPDVRHVLPQHFQNTRQAKFHTVNRMALLASLSDLKCEIRTALGCVYRLVHQTPFYLYPMLR